MKIIRVQNLKGEELRSILERRARMGEDTSAERSRQIFGEELTPQEVVDRILQSIQEEGDAALLRYTEEIDGVKLTPNQLLVEKNDIDEAYSQVDEAFLQAVRRACKNIEVYHRNQLRNSWFMTGENGAILGQRVVPLSSVGVYVPGGRAPYPSTVLMNVIPAKVAGVKEIVMVSPPSKEGKINPYILVAAAEAGAHKIYKAGGAQAIGALAYGTATIPRVDKIVGPGNIFVALAKRAVFGRVGIDMIAGPSEIAVVADDSASPSFIAADLLSQAEHDPDAASILITTSEDLAQRVKREVEVQLANLSRKEVASASIAKHGYIMVADSLELAFKIVNEFAPEHLELMLREPFKYLEKVTNAGAIFLGPYSPEPVGDYMAGSNHVLPTGGTARFSSGLSVDDFVKTIGIVGYSKEALRSTGRDIVRLTEAEGLDAHGRAISIRLGGD